MTQQYGLNDQIWSCVLFVIDRAMFAPACLSHEIITRKWVFCLCPVLLLWYWWCCYSPVPLQPLVWLSVYVALSVVTGWMCMSRARLCLVLCSAGTAASRTAFVTTAVIALRLVHARYIWSTAAHGLTATRRALRSEIRWPDRKWASSSSSLIWALTCSEWHSSRAWRLAHYWACSIMATEPCTQKLNEIIHTHTHTITSMS